MISAFHPRVLVTVAIATLASPFLVAAAPASPPAASASEQDEDNPTPAPLTVGSMAIASSSALTIEGMAVDIAADKVSYHLPPAQQGDHETGPCGQYRDA